MKVIDNLRVTTAIPFFQNPSLELLSKLNWNICIDAFPIFSILYKIALRSRALSQLLKVSKIDVKNISMRCHCDGAAKEIVVESWSKSGEHRVLLLLLAHEQPGQI